jgi:hypothetical protein
MPSKDSIALLPGTQLIAERLFRGDNRLLDLERVSPSAICELDFSGAGC